MLSANEQALLKTRHRISFAEEWPGAYYPLSDIRDGDSNGRFISEYTLALSSPKPSVTGSLFIKRYSTLIVGALYGFTFSSYGMDLTRSNISLVLDGQSIAYHIWRREEPEVLHHVCNREKKRERYIRHMLEDNVTPIFQQMVRQCGIDSATLWSTLSYLLAYWKNSWLQDAALSWNYRRIEEDYAYLVQKAEPEWFGESSGNPLSASFLSVDDPLYPGKSIWLRRKCCLNYCLPGGDRYCYTCPRISDKRRIEKYREVH
jgi:ferric iron reductase protein FhuF